MKILIVSNLYYPNVFGGAERSVQKVAESLSLLGHEISVATLNPKGQHETREINGVHVHYLPSRNIYFFGLPKRRPVATKLAWHCLDTYNPWMGASLGHILDAERPDVVNTHNLAGFSGSVWRSVKKRRLPLVHTVRDHYLLCPRSMFRRGKGCRTLCTTCRLYSRPRRMFSRLVDVVTAVSQDVLDRHCLHGCFPESQRMVVYNALEPDLSYGTRRAERNGTLHFGFLGRLHPSKGVDELIRSFLELPDGRAQLLIAGRGAPEYEDYLRRRINGNPSIQMLGFVSPSDFLAQVDVAVVPSVCQDCAPRAVLESMALHRPLIGARRGGIPELMGKGTGWMFDPDEPEALTRTLHLAIQSPKELAAMSGRAGERIQQFSTETMVRGYLKAFACAIEKNRNAETR